MNCSEGKFFGQHLILNCRAGELAAISCKETLQNFIDELVSTIGMEKHGPARIEHFGEEAHLKGYTIDQLIKTSNICFHFAEQSSNFFGDIFSCKRFDIGKVRECVLKYFHPKEITELCIDRGI